MICLDLRNGTSYDRYWEGRKSFAAMISNIRSLTRQIWVNAALPPTGDAPIFVKGKTPIATLSAAHLRKRKVDTLRLCLSFAFAVKHYLRGEDGTQWEDYADVLPASFARFDEVGYNTQKTSNTGSYDATRRSSLSASQDGSLSGRASPDATKRIRVKRSKPKLSAGQDTPLLPNTITHRNIEFHPFADQASLPLPLMIAHELSRALFKFRREGCFETVGPAGANAMNVLIQGMVDQLTAMERVANTPLPASYSIHLKQCVTLYLFALPFTLVKDLGWSTVPLVTVVAFTFMGIEGIADEIEMPFGTDQCDLPLDRYCQDLKEEVEYTIGRLPEGGQGGHGFDDGEGYD